MRSLSHIATQITNAQRADYVRTPGVEYLGGGSYGAAYRHVPSGRVLKVSYSLDDGTMDYIAAVARYCAKHGKPPHMAPMVYEFGQCGTYWYAVMEYVEVGEVHATRETMRAAVWAIMQPMGGLRRGVWRGDKYAYLPAASSDDAGYDLHAGNTGTTRDGREVVFDPFGGNTRGAKRAPKRVQTKLQHGPSRGRWAH